MLQQDYLMRMFTALAIAMRESMLRAQGDEDPEGAAELLEAALDKTTEIDGALLLQMAPESFVAMVQLSQTDPALIGYISRTLMLESTIFLKLDSMSVPPCEPNKHRLLRVLMASN